MKTKRLEFGIGLEQYFKEYLIKERGCSNHTIRAYRDAFVLLIKYFEQALNIKPEKITLDTFTKSNILGYLDWLEKENGASVSTRNHRLTVLKSYSHYMSYKDPLHFSQWKDIQLIPNKKGIQSSVPYLTIEEVTVLLQQIDTSTEKGRRNLTLLSFLYNSAMRVQELIDMTPSSLRLSKPYVVEIFGKGGKKRIVPLDDNIVELLRQYLKEHKLDEPGQEKHPLFYNSWNEKLTTPGITYIIKKYYSKAKECRPELFKNTITPHIFRHSRAMHLLQSGVNLVYIRDILGHVSITTTEIYARADSNQKRVALENAYQKIGLSEPTVKSWEKNPKLKDFLKSLA